MTTSYIEVEQALVTCFQTAEETRFSAGDLLLALGENAPIKQLAASVGRSASYLHLLRQTSRVFPPGDRAQDMPWSIHALCARTPEPEQWLALAVGEQMSVRQLRDAMIAEGILKPRKGKPERDVLAALIAASFRENTEYDLFHSEIEGDPAAAEILAHLALAAIEAA